MQRAICESCGAIQPPEWRAGDLCTGCGAAVREERRCPWCTRYSPGNFCRGCGCALVEPALFGAARMLKDAGVDRLTLIDRLRALDAGQVQTFSAQYAAQLAIVARRVDEARLVESCLLLARYSARLEDDLVPSLPLRPETLAGVGGGPQGPFVAREDLLEKIEADSPVPPTRDAASLALMRRGKITAERVSTAISMLFGYDDLAVEAALALAHWRVQRAPWRGAGIDERARFDAGWLALAAFDRAATRSWAALASAWPIESLRTETWRGAADEARSWFAALEPALREGLASTDDDLRFGCALVLRDETALAEWIADADELRRELAQRALAKTGGSLAMRRIIAADDEERSLLLRNLPQPWSNEVLSAAMESFARSGKRVREEILRGLRYGKFAERDAGARSELGRFLMANAAEIGRDEIFDFVTWATAREHDAEPPPEAEVRDFLDVGAAILEGADADALSLALRESGEGLRRLLAYARPADRPLLDRLLRDPKTAAQAWSLLRQMERDVERRGGAKNPLPLDLFLGAWDRAGVEGRRAWVVAMHGTRETYPIVSHELFLEALWTRFKESEPDRLALRQLLEDCHLAWELSEKTKAELPDWPGGGRDPLDAFRWLLAFDPERVYDALDRALDKLDPKWFGELWRAALAAAEPLTDRSTKALPPIGRLTRSFREAFEAHGALSPEAAPWREDLDAFTAAARALMAKTTGTPGEDASWGAMKVKELEEEIAWLYERLASEKEKIDQARLQAEARAAQEEQRKRAAEERLRAEQEALRRQSEMQERARRDAEARERERSSTDAAERDREARLRAFDELEAQRRAARGEPPLPPRAPPPRTGPTAPEPVSPPAPTIPPQGIDNEPLLPGQPLPTIAAYAAFMRALQRGGDFMSLMQAHGMDVTSWTANANAWTQIFLKRPDVALRFAALLQG